MFSQKVLSIKESPIRKFAPMRERVAEKGINVIPLNIGQPDICTPKVFFDAIRAIDHHDVIAYTASQGTDELLKAFSSYYKKHNIDFEPKDFIVTNGGSEALSYVFATLCNKDDEVLVFSPYYANYNSIARINDAKIVPVPTKRENNFRIPPKDVLRSYITDRTRAILVTNPNNPTGLVLRENEIKDIVDTVDEYGLFLISDEVYREFIYDDAKFISFSDYPLIRDKLIIIDSVSKRYSACGMRIGCIASKNKAFVDQVMKLCQARLCVPYVEQVGAAALINEDISAVNASIAEYKVRRDICTGAMKDIAGVEYQTPEGAFYFIVKLPVEDAEDFTAWILTHFSFNGETILLCPASEFYASEGIGASEVRISYCIAQDDLKRAMHILRLGLEEYRKTRD
jgi:aspartate aminotransferase